MKNTFLIISINIVIAVWAANIFAQTDKKLKIDADKIKIDAAKLFDAKKIGRQISNLDQLRDLGLKSAVIYWHSRGGNTESNFELDVAPILTKNSKEALIYARNDKGEFGGAFKIRIEALDKIGKTVETCDQNMLGWTIATTETEYTECRFFDKTCKQTTSFRITADPDGLLKETNTKNNVIIVKKTKYTGKIYSTTIYPETDKP